MVVFESHPLWLSIRGFPFDDPAHAVPFSARLRREQGWTCAYASRVLDEYRRFLFLTVTHDELMVPSEAVDQAWHLHMIDTRAYWDELCGRAVGHPIHHTPSRGGAAEDSRHPTRTRRRCDAIGRRSVKRRLSISGRALRSVSRHGTGASMRATCG